MTNSLTIKNLAIAVEALSHCNAPHLYAVSALLEREIQKAKEIDEAPKTPTDPNDDIPF